MISWQQLNLVAFTLAAVFCVGTSTSSAIAEQCTLKRIAAIPMTHEKGGGVSIPVMINGTNRKFLVAPGATYSAIFEDVAVAMALQIEHLDSVRVYSANGKPVSHYAYISEIGIGGTIGKGAHFLDAKRTTEQQDIAGVIGTDVLKNFDLDLDFGSLTLNLFSPDHCAGRVVYWAKDYVDIDYVALPGGTIQVPATLDGRDLRANLDTGDDRNYINADLANHAYSVDDHSPDAVPVPGAKPGDLVQSAYRFKLLSLEGVAVKNPMFALLHDKAEKAFELDEGKIASAIPGDTLGTFDLTLGFDTLSKLHIYLAYGEHKIYITAVSAGKTPPS